MELILRARSTDGDSSDVVVDLDADHLVEELNRALATELGLGDRSAVVTVSRTGVTLDPKSEIGASGIVSGDELVIGRPLNMPEVPAVPKHAVSVDVLAGPDAGVSVALLPGSYSIGRSRASDVVLDDPTVSRSHLTVTVDDGWTVTVRPNETVANEVTVNDTVVDDGTVVVDDDVVGVGGTRLAFRRFVRADDQRRDQLGQIEFQRTPYRPPVISERDVPELGKIPEQREGRRFQLLSVLAPLAAGLAFFAFSRQPQFLVLTAMSPIVAVANYFEDKRTGRRKFEADSGQFADRVLEWRSEINDVLARERVERLRAAPDLADLARRAELRTADLWARGRAAPDFLRLRVGLGTAESGSEPEIPNGGEDALRRDAEAALIGTDILHDVPITTDLADHGAVGIHGPVELVTGTASSMVIQATTLHSPEDLTLVAAVCPERAMNRWLKWLPHMRSISSPIGGNHMAATTEEAAELLGALLEVAEFRTHKHERDVDKRWPWILAVIDVDLRPDPADVARLLDLCPAAGISVVWLANSAAEVPRQAGEVLVAGHGPGAALVGTLWSTDPEVAERTLEVEQIRVEIADRVARSLAPIRDASTASLASSIPRVAPLLGVLEVGHPTAEWVAEKWAAHTGYGLPFPIGMGADGPLVLDLVGDGPHTLIGGTSGAGKSELMQSIVSSLAVHHPPNRLNFLFVDYKGGASSNVFGALPHTVGYVTNLSAELSIRALTSLRAELNRRMQVMEGKAKDLEEMLELFPEEAPASLVIVVDEFATLVKEVPEFVAGVVDIAQRGRSLGIHLILATQRPSGSVNENILANTNLRISLRMLDRSESMSVINSPEAGDIPVPLKGRAYARLGPRHLASFQSAYCGAPLTTSEIATPILIAPFVRTNDSPKSAAGAGAGAGPGGGVGGGVPSGTHLDAILDAVRGAFTALAIAEPRKPWREVLPDLVTLTDVLEDPRSEPAHDAPGRVIAMGMIDAPERQDQSPALIDLEEGGGWLVFGSGGSGKTTVLRTLAVSAASTGRPDQVEIIGFDFASRGLASLLPLPHVIDVASGDDLEAVTRHILTLSSELARRRELLAGAHAEHLSAYNQRHAPLSRILVLIDGFGALSAQFLTSGGGAVSVAIPMERWFDMIQDVIVEGRQVGIHVVMTSDRRNAVPSRVHSAVANKLVLRHADEHGYGEHGVSATRSKGLDLQPGRGLWQAASVVQLASVSADPVGKAQSEMIERFAESFRTDHVSSLASNALPDIASLADLREIAPPSSRLTFPLGVSDCRGDAAMIDMTWSSMLVAGGPRSGRSTTLSTCAAGLAGTHQLWGMGPASSMLDRALLDAEAFGRAEVIVPAIDRLVNVIEMGPSGKPHVLLFDDLDLFDDTALNGEFERLARLDDLRIIATVEGRSLSGYTTNPLLTNLRRARRLIILAPDDPTDVMQASGVKAPIRPGQRMLPGRGILVADRVPSVVQVAMDTVT